MKNSIRNVAPHVLKYLKNEHDADAYSFGSSKKIETKCIECGFEKQTTVRVLCKGGFYCNVCSDGTPFSEKFMSNILLSLGVEFIPQYRPNWSENKKYDFYIPSMKIIIETHGIQHYVQSNRGRSLREEQANDILKEKLAMRNGIEHYIVINCKATGIDAMVKEIEKHFNGIFILDNINYKNIYEISQKSLIVQVCKRCNEIINFDKNSTVIKILMKEFGIGYSSIRRYLKKGVEIGVCDYNAQHEKIKANKRNRTSKSIEQYTLDGHFIKVWDSIKTIKQELNIPHAKISECCRGRAYTAAGYKWKYK